MSTWSRRQWGLYWLFVLAAGLVAVFLSLTLEFEDLASTAAIVASAMVFLVLFFVLIVIRLLRQR